MIIPDELPSHMNRYFFAAPYCIGRDVLDIACGAGYGSNLIARRAKKVVGADLDYDTIIYANTHFFNDNIRFIQEDCTALNIQDRFDAIISFETLEHISPEKTNDFFEGIKRILKNGGICLISTPYVKKDGPSPFNEYHINEMTIPTFKKTVNKYFADVEYYYQEMNEKGAIIPECFVDVSNFLPYALTIIAVCYHNP